MAKNRDAAIIAYNGIDGACAAAVALLRFPSARLLISSARSIGRALATFQEARRPPDEIHVCGLGVYCDWDEVERAAKATSERGSRIVWYCGRGYLDAQRERFARISTPVFLDLASNTEGVCRHLGLEGNPQAGFLCNLAKNDPQISLGRNRRTEEEEFWIDLVSASYAEYAKYHDCERYAATIAKLARRQCNAADERLVVVYRQSGFRYAMAGKSPGLRHVQELIRKCAAVDEPILILGESGVGKEHVAHLIHERGSRATEPVVALNCAAFSGNVGLANSTLFGHRKGAFTGAVKDRPGAFMAASGGVLFLDEVGELPLEVQGKLLRVLEDRLITPEGTDTPIGPVDVQVIAATNRDVPGMVRRKEFREDLFYRLAVLRIAVPPLRDRREDIDAVVESALAGLATDRRLRKLTRQDCQALCQYDWPGNARQLINVLRRAVYMDLAIADVIEEERQIASPTVLETPEDPKRLLPASACEVRPIKEVQQAYAARALALHGDNLRATAKALGIAVNTLRSWLRGQ